MNSNKVIDIIPSKSVYIRALILAFFSRREIKLIGNIYGDDVISTYKALNDLGGNIETTDYGFLVKPYNKLNLDKVIDCKESATLYRFLNNILPSLKLTGSDRLLERVKSAETSQNYSGKLLREYIDGTKVIEDYSNLPSKGYIELTKKVIEDFKNVKDSYIVEGDYSLASIFLLLGLFKEVSVRGLNIDSKQGDKYILDIIRMIGGDILIKDEIIKVSHNKLNPIDIDGSLVPDLVPLISVVGTVLNGETIIRNVSYLRYKESNRFSYIEKIINDLSGKAKIEGNDLHIFRKDLKEGKVSSMGDHRICFMLSLIEEIYGIELEIDDRTCVKKSYPNYWEVLNG